MPSTVYVCPVRVSRCAPVAAFHKEIIPSLSPLANICPSGLNARLKILPVYPVIVFWSSPVSIFHRWIFSSQFALANVRPSELKAKLEMPSLLLLVRAFRSSPVAVSHKRIVLPLAAASVRLSALMVRVPTSKFPVCTGLVKMIECLRKKSRGNHRCTEVFCFGFYLFCGAA